MGGGDAKPPPRRMWLQQDNPGPKRPPRNFGGGLDVNENSGAVMPALLGDFRFIMVPSAAPPA